MFCKHEWSLLTETTSKSYFEISMKAMGDAGVSKSGLPHQLCDASRKLVQVFTCSKCGKLKRFVTDI